MEGIGLIEKTIKNKICWREGNIDDLQLFNDEIKQVPIANNKVPRSSDDHLSAKANSGVRTRSAAAKEYTHLPDGVGINGVVFETQRPDDPEAFAMRFRERKALQKSQISFGGEDIDQNELRASEIGDEDLKELFS